MKIYRVICPYCGKKAEFKSSAIIYGGYDYGMAYICSGYPDCNSYVGVHSGTSKPLGTLANSELRSWRKKVHRLFDPHWQRKKDKRKARTRCYSWLAQELGISKTKCHIAMFDVSQCQAAIKILIKRE